MRRRALRREASQASSKRQLLSLSHTFAIQCRKLKRSQSFCPSPSQGGGCARAERAGGGKILYIYSAGPRAAAAGCAPCAPSAGRGPASRCVGVCGDG